MSLERKDVRAKVDADVHQALTAICLAKGMDLAEFIESIIAPEVRRLVHEATVIVESLPRSGKTGTGRD